MSHQQISRNKMQKQAKRLQLQDQEIIALKKRWKNKFQKQSEDEDQIDEMVTNSIVPKYSKTPQHRTVNLKLLNGKQFMQISWHIEAQTILCIEGRVIRNNEEKFRYLYMHMFVTARKRIQKQYNLRLKMGMNFKASDFLECVEGTFGDPNEKKKPLTYFKVLKQETDETFSGLITNFE